MFTGANSSFARGGLNVAVQAWLIVNLRSISRSRYYLVADMHFRKNGRAKDRDLRDSLLHKYIILTYLVLSYISLVHVVSPPQSPSSSGGFLMASAERLAAHAWYGMLFFCDGKVHISN